MVSRRLSSFIVGLIALLMSGASAVGCAPEDEDVGDGQSSAVIGGGVADPSKAKSDRVMATSTLYNRKVRLHISDADNMAWASIDDGNPGDEVWLDKSMNGGFDWDGRVGKTKIPNGGRGWRTQMYGIDGATSTGKYWGSMRACGKAGDRSEITCTPWFRSIQNAATPEDAAATAMMMFYDTGDHMFRTTGWWNAANALTALIDYEDHTGNRTMHYVIADIFDHNKWHPFQDKNYQNKLMDDTGWWALAWVRAYDITQDKRYLDMARGAADYMWQYQDGTCGGGVWWSTEKKYKNAITNELYIKLAAALHNRMPGEKDYLAHAKQVWDWFDKSGMINDKNRINDGLNGDCKNNGDTEWTYNQGVILGGLVELHKATKDESILTRAIQIADAATTADNLNLKGILREPCENGDCGPDGATFKGAFVRNLGELNRYLPDHPYDNYLWRNQMVIRAQNRTSLDQYGVHWSGPIDKVNAAAQSSALDLLISVKH